MKTNLHEGITDDPAMAARLRNGVSVEEGAKTHVYLASSDEVEGVTGQNFEKCSPINKCKYLIAAFSHALDKKTHRRLWDESMKLCGLSA